MVTVRCSYTFIYPYSIYSLYTLIANTKHGINQCMSFCYYCFYFKIALELESIAKYSVLKFVMNNSTITIAYNNSKKSVVKKFFLSSSINCVSSFYFYTKFFFKIPLCVLYMPLLIYNL